MFYKVLYKLEIIDVLNRLDYAAYIKELQRFIITDKSSAHCIVASNRHDFYHVAGLKYPEGIDLITVTLIEISETEYTKLCTKLFKLNSDDAVNSTLDALKDQKIKEMSDICHQSIIAGIQVSLSDEHLHHFELTLEDQINLLEIKNQLDTGLTSVIYHETGKSCCEFSRDDMYKIVNAYLKHKQFHLTQFNKLRDHILSLETISEVAKVKYDLSL